MDIQRYHQEYLLLQYAFVIRYRNTARERSQCVSLSSQDAYVIRDRNTAGKCVVVERRVKNVL